MTSRSAVPGSLLTELDLPLQAALDGAETSVRLAAPYIGARVASALAAAAKKSRATWQLLTVLDPVAVAYGSLSLDGLRRLLNAGVDIRDLDGLHGKVYLTEAAGFIGSGNLTSAGLGRSARANLELSVTLDATQRDAAEAVFGGWWEQGTTLTTKMIAACQKQAALVPTRVSRKPAQSQADKRLGDLADDLLDEALATTVWVKAVYDDRASADGTDYMGGPGIIANPDNQGRPKISTGDLVVIWAREAKSCHAVVRVLSDSERNPERAIAAGLPEDEAVRWPWINDVEGAIQIPAADGLPLEELGLTGQSLQGGYCHMPAGGETTLFRWMSSRKR